MKKENYFIRVITSWLLLLVFLAPTGIELIKSVEKHKHNSCTETSTHIHQKHDPCSLCDFNFSNFDLNFNSKSYTQNNILQEKNYPIYLDRFFHSHKKYYFSRGPPSYS